MRALGLLVCLALAAAASTLLVPSATATHEQPPPGTCNQHLDALGLSVRCLDKAFKCSDYPGVTTFGEVKVEMTAAAQEQNTVAFYASGCGGSPVTTFARVEVDTWLTDGVRIVGNANFEVNDGYIACHDRGTGAHQDGIQVMGADHVRIRSLVVDCQTANHAMFFANDGSNNPADVYDVVVEDSWLGPYGHTVHLGHSTNTGVRDSIVCKNPPFTWEQGPPDVTINPIDEGNTFQDDCSDVPPY